MTAWRMIRPTQLYGDFVFIDQASITFISIQLLVWNVMMLIIRMPTLRQENGGTMPDENLKPGYLCMSLLAYSAKATHNPILIQHF